MNTNPMDYGPGISAPGALIKKKKIRVEQRDLRIEVNSLEKEKAKVTSDRVVSQ